MSFVENEEGNQQRQRAMRGLPRVTVTLSVGEACRLATLTINKRCSMDRQRDKKAKERGGYFVPPEGQKDIDLKKMEGLEDLAYRLIKGVPDEFITAAKLKALVQAKRNGLSVYDALKGLKQEPPHPNHLKAQEKLNAERTDG